MLTGGEQMRFRALLCDDVNSMTMSGGDYMIPKDVLMKAVAETDITADMESDKISHKTLSLEYDGNRLYANCKVLNTPQGKLLEKIIKDGGCAMPITQQKH